MYNANILKQDYRSDPKLTNYRIVCRVLSDDGGHIQKVGITDDMSSDAASYSATPKAINNMIDKGDKCFVTNEAGVEVEVDQFGDDFIRTKPDGKIENNLRHLRKCEFTKE